MIEQQGRVVALETGAVWVETHRSSTCSACSARNGCGQGLMDSIGIGQQRKMLRASSALNLDVGDSVVVGVREDALVRWAVFVYLLPLLALLAASFVASWMALGEPYVIAAGLIGFLLAWFAVRAHARRRVADPQLQPVVLRMMLADGVGLFPRGSDLEGSKP
ncbi:SoxR reducing system RseC family protein [Stutzerimonas marianensis]